MSGTSEKIYQCWCLRCGDTWREREWPEVCPECHSRNVAHALLGSGSQEGVEVSHDAA